jgi:diacylglycerol kinase (ATP)
MRALIIAHPSVGVHKEKRAFVEQIVSHIAKGGGNVDVTYIMKPGSGMKFSSRAALEGYDAVFAAGGDGTVNDVASGLVNRKTPLGVIPFGTGNGLANALNIPFEPEGYFRMLDEGKSIAIDTGRIATRFFFSVAGIGYDAAIAREFNRKEYPFRTVKSLYSIAIKQYFLRRSEKVTLTIDGNVTTRKVFGITFCNTGHYGAGAVISPGSNPRDGKLDAVIIPHLNPISGYFAMRKLFDGTISSVRGIEYIPFSSLTIKRSRAGLCQADGETFPAEETVSVSVMPGALHVLSP